MTVFLLIEEYEQDEYLNKRKEPASPFGSIMGVYQKREKAERDLTAFEEMKPKNESRSLYIEERPLL